MRRLFIIGAAVAVLAVAGVSLIWPAALWAYLLIAPVVVLGGLDIAQKRQAVRRNFPLIGNFRYFFELIRPEINQYFVESNTDGTPFNREMRSVVYQRAKGQLDSVPFGTQLDVYETGYEWLNHSMAPVTPAQEPPHVLVGAAKCDKPYAAALLNISAMSYGSLSKNAVLALSQGAKAGGFAHNTGEGGVSPYHLEGGADLIWQIGTGYFGCRSADGGFDAGQFAETATLPNVKMVEIKLSQGAKPGHGGILPGRKVTNEIAAIRGVPLGEDVISPPAHRAFQTPLELLQFVARLRDLSGGKPIGIKLCVGKRREFLALCKAMVECGEHPDFVTVDGGEGGTGAAPLEFSNRLGCPLTEGLVFVHNALTGIGRRENVRVFAAGKVVTGFDMARLLAIGADACSAARAMMMSLGCIQARRCNSNDCPVGVATQKPHLVHGLVVVDKAKRVARYQHETVTSLLELISAAGLGHPSELRPWHVLRRTGPTKLRHYGELHEYIDARSLLGATVPAAFARAWHAARTDSFASATPD